MKAGLPNSATARNHARCERLLIVGLKPSNVNFLIDRTFKTLPS